MATWSSSRKSKYFNSKFKADNKMLFVTGGAGFIGSNFVRQALSGSDSNVVNIDALTYAGNLENLRLITDSERHTFIHGNICDSQLLGELLLKYRPRKIVNFAAESHVDRSIVDPASFVTTNVVGTFCLLEATRIYWATLEQKQKSDFRFLHVSTDEVYGSLGPNDLAFTETTPYAPNSPYAASKASSDHLARAYFHTYGFPVITTNCSNNYGPYQFPEKLIPLCIKNALEDKPLPIYGDGKQIRDWLYVTDHCSAIQRVLAFGRPGEIYNIGGWNEKTNLEVVHALCSVLDEENPRKDGKSYAEQITFVKDRLGHDRRYAINAGKVERELSWQPQETFESGIRKTVLWYLKNKSWVKNVTSGAYRQWIDTQYAQN